MYANTDVYVCVCINTKQFIKRYTNICFIWI